MENEIHLTDIQITPFRPKNGFLGFCSCHINNQFYVGDIAIFSRPGGGIRLGFPEKKLANGSKVDVFLPLNTEIEKAIETAVLERYEKLMECAETGRKQNGNKGV